MVHYTLAGLKFYINTYGKFYKDNNEASLLKYVTHLPDLSSIATDDDDDFKYHCRFERSLLYYMISDVYRDVNFQQLHNKFYYKRDGKWKKFDHAEDIKEYVEKNKDKIFNLVRDNEMDKISRDLHMCYTEHGNIVFYLTMFYPDIMCFDLEDFLKSLKEFGIFDLDKLLEKLEDKATYKDSYPNLAYLIETFDCGTDMRELIKIAIEKSFVKYLPLIY